MKKLISLLLISIFIISAGTTATFAEDDIYADVGDVEFDADAGTTPDSPWYGVDQFFETVTVGKDPEAALDYRDEKIAEAYDMIEKGKPDAAVEALENAGEYNDILEKQVSPEVADEAAESGKAITQLLDEIDDDLEGGEWDDVKGLMSETTDQAATIVRVGKISKQIADLCEELAKLDPNEFSRMCPTMEDDPEWKKDLNKRLVGDQKEGVREFGEIVEDCIGSSGQDCRCGDIPFLEFSSFCYEASALAIRCEIEGDEAACEELEKKDPPRLTDPAFQAEFERVEQKMFGAKFDVRRPQPCIDEGITDPDKCHIHMIKTEAPPECVDALLASGSIGPSEGRKICEKIMMEEHSPKCLEKGIDDPNECARFMDNYREPGKHEGDFVKFDCRSIKDDAERLDCYDKMTAGVEEYTEHVKDYVDINDPDYNGPCMTKDDWDAKKAECQALYGPDAGDKPIMGDSGEDWGECVVDAVCMDFGPKEGAKCHDCETFCREKYGDGNLIRTWCSDAGCECEWGDSFDTKPEGDWSGSDGGSNCDDCESKCSGTPSRTDCVNGECKCYYEDVHFEDNPPAPDGGPATSGEGSGSSQAQSDAESAAQQEASDAESAAQQEASDAESAAQQEASDAESAAQQAESDSSSDSGGDNSGGSDGGGEAVTGELVSNPFLDYYYG